MLHETSIRAPFESMWFEWETFAYGDEPEGAYRSNLTRHSDTCVVLTTKPEEDRVSMLMGWDGVAQRDMGKNYPVPMFVTLTFPYEAFVTGDLTNIYDGGPAFWGGAITDIGKELAARSGEEPEELYRDAMDCVCPVLWSWLLLQCKNVSLAETQPQHRNSKRQKDPLRVLHKELRVQVPPGSSHKKSVSENDGQTGTAFHIRRGHFADYTKGRGLFGKYHGKYWIPPTTVGDAEYGTVVKNYRLEGVQ